MPRALKMIAIATLVSAAPSAAQVHARQATPDEVARAERGAAARPRTEVANPMLLEVSLAGVERLKPDQAWVSKTTSSYSCDQAIVEEVRVERHNAISRKNVKLKIIPRISSGWYRQDIDLTLDVRNPDGNYIGHRSWDNMTIGNAKGPYSGGTKSPEMSLELPAERFAQLFTSENSPVLKIIVEIQGEEGDEDED